MSRGSASEPGKGRSLRPKRGRFVLEIERSPDGRLEGALEIAATSRRHSFSGTLELLHVIEEALAQLPIDDGVALEIS